VHRLKNSRRAPAEQLLASYDDDAIIEL